MKGIIVYFSGTGNTKFVAMQIKKYFEDEGVSVDICSIEDDFKIKDNLYDFIVFGSPKHYEYTPYFFENWLENNVPVFKKETPVILYLTGTAPTKTSFNSEEAILKNKNCRVVISKTIRMPNNYLINFFSGTSPDNFSAYTFEASTSSKKIVTCFLKGEVSKEKVRPLMAHLCKDVSKYFGKRTGKAGKHFSADDTCIQCGLCIKSCPTKNITLENNRITFSDKCIMCTRCINICPSNAIIYKEKKVPQYRYHMDKIA
ncbi:EFR1 family ferrodoxin [Clostridium sp. DL1XJH146]